ncbi:MAG: hypothetical protein ACTSUE_16680 [Promethearchaeota archaeon]
MKRKRRQGRLHKIDADDPPSRKARRKRKKKVEQYDLPTEILFKPKNKLEDTDYFTPILHNTVSVMNTQKGFDQGILSQEMEYFEFIQHKFAAITVRPLQNATLLLYITGKFIVVGTSSLLEARLIPIIYLSEVGKVRERRFIRNKDDKIVDVEYYPISRKIRYGDTKLVNTVYKCWVEPKSIFLNEIHKNNQESVSYSPEAFPAPVIRGNVATYLVFQNGYCLILGLPNPTKKTLMQAYEELISYINEAARTKEDWNVISTHIWKLNKADLLRQFQKNQCEGEGGKRRKAISFPDSRVGSSSRRKKKNNFEKRLTDHYGFGSYQRTDKSIDDGLHPNVLHRMRLDNFGRRLSFLLDTV